MLIENFINKISIELSFHHKDRDKDKLLIKAFQQAARELYATAWQLQDRHPPQIALILKCIFDRDKEICIFDDSDTFFATRKDMEFYRGACCQILNSAHAKVLDLTEESIVDNDDEG